ncbi:UPF0147 family protein [Candidatus Woesearchaeota archaeon]|nr:UPF0147 family protein [Candidatus Woesearchaeota archaeon]
MMQLENLPGIMEGLSAIEKDNTVPKNVRIRIKTAMELLGKEDKKWNIRIDQSLEALGEVADDPNLPPYARMQIWSVVSQLESK